MFSFDKYVQIFNEVEQIMEGALSFWVQGGIKEVKPFHPCRLLTETTLTTKTAATTETEHGPVFHSPTPKHTCHAFLSRCSGPQAHSPCCGFDIWKPLTSSLLGHSLSQRTPHLHQINFLLVADCHHRPCLGYGLTYLSTIIFTDHLDVCICMFSKPILCLFI